MRQSIRKIQQGLIELGYDLGRWGADGLYGPATERALRAFIARTGYKAPAPEPASNSLLPTLPWIEEGRKVFGLHEVRDNAELKAWLRSDGKTLGDPKSLPWCGDFTETAIKNSLPNEPFTGDLGTNPYWARNWTMFGKTVRPCYGCVLVFERGSGGHVGFAMGEDNTDFYVLGGNQSDSVNIVRISKKRLLSGGARWPSTHGGDGFALPRMTPGSIPRSTNEF
jgi:uncharacterized protein (TIGR02594 family)